MCKEGFWVCNSCSTLPSPGRRASLDQCCGNNPSDLPSPTPAASAVLLLSRDRQDLKRVMSGTEQRFVITCFLRGREVTQREMQ